MKNWANPKDSKKRAMYKEQKGKCWLCGKHMHPPEVTYDHVTPKSSGGSDSIRNLRLAHYRCNQKRGTMGLYSMVCL
jgi:5-methylcytosine-specific restriction endonuclease McrA